jgi:PilZ domain
MVGLTEQRKSKRYDLGALVSFFWKGLQGKHFRGAGFMRDVSVRGVFVLTPTPPPIGSTIHLEICFESSLTDSPLAILAKGQVCRVEPDNQNGERCGFAASTKRFKLKGHGIRQFDVDNIC